MLPFCQDQKIAVIPWSPLAKGRLARKPSKEQNETQRAQTDAIGKRLYSDEDLTIAQRVSDVAEARKLPMAQVAYSMDAFQTGHYRPNYWRNQASSPGGCCCSRLCPAHPGGDPPFGRSISSTSHTRLCVIC